MQSGNYSSISEKSANHLPLAALSWHQIEKPAVDLAYQIMCCRFEAGGVNSRTGLIQRFDGTAKVGE